MCRVAECEPAGPPSERGPNGGGSPPHRGGPELGSGNPATLDKSLRGSYNLHDQGGSLSEQEWSSYLHDGRSIHVRQLGKGWQVTCERATETGDDLRAAMRAAIGLSEGERRSEPARDLALRRWVESHAEQIERESA